MKTTRFLLAAFALFCLGSNAWADTSLLTAADGWTKISSVPTSTEIANNYYVFVDATNDLMLGIGKGEQNTKAWYSLGLYYRTSVSPTSKDITPMVWTLESNGDGFSMRNLDQPVHLFQTEWQAAWYFDTNDVTSPNSWSKVNIALSDGKFTLENGTYTGNYIGPWTDNDFTNGAECAGNKTTALRGYFYIYSISRAQFKQNLLDNASSSNPVDITPWYVTNSTFDAGNRTGWTEEGSGGNNNTHARGGGCEIWHRSSFNIHQDVTLPNGKYKVSLQMAGTSGAGKVYGTSNGTTKEAASSAAGGSNFQNTILSMIQDRTFGQTTTDEITVSNGSLTIGMKCETTDQWINFDNFKLYCTGLDLSAYEEQLSDLVDECNDFIDSDVVPTACETAISSAITTYNQSYETAKEYSTAIVALTNVLDTYRNNTELKTAYANYYAFKIKIETFKTGQSSSSELTTFNNAITTATTAVEAATTAAAIDTQTANLRSAGLTYISSVEGQFDITFLASQNYWDWKKKDDSNAGVVTDQFLTNRPNTIPSFAESYETTCATTGTVLYQTVSNLPAGYYQVGMYAAAMYTSGRGFDTEATEGDAGRTFAFAGDLSDNSSILRTGTPISFNSVRNFDDLTTLDVNVHLSNAGDLTFGVQKDANGSNWHFAQIVSIIYSNAPDLTLLKDTRDALVAEATGLKNGADAVYLTSAQQTALQSAIDAGEAADDFDELNTVTLTTLPNAINTAKQQVQQAKAAIPAMIAALERFENDYNLQDGTDYSRVTMSAGAWTDLLAKVNAVTTALDDISQASTYATKAQELVDQMDATDASLRLFKSYKAMVEGTQSLSIAAGTTYGADSYMATDATENTAIEALNTAFKTYAANQISNINMAGFLGDNLDFNAAEGSNIVQRIYDVAGWEEVYEDVTDWSLIRNQDSDAPNVLHIRSNWTATATTLLAQKMKMLPEGSYKLSFNWTSNKGNMTNKSVYKLGAATPVELGNNTNVATDLEYEFEVTGAATPFDLVFGFIRNTADANNHPSDIKVDNVALVCLITDEFKEAYEAAQAVSSDAATKAAAKAAITQYADNYASEAALNGFADAATRTAAIKVLQNAKTIADADGNATSLIVNGDLANTTLTNDTPYGWSKANVDVSGGSDVWINTQDAAQVFNYWKETINDIEFYQVINNLPNGVYRFSVDLGTNNIPEGGAARMVAYMYCTGDPIGASEQVTVDNGDGHRDFGTYTCAVDVNGNQVQIGVRSLGHYIQMRNISLEYIGSHVNNAVEVASSYLRQDYFWGTGNLWHDFTGDKYSAAKNVKVYPTAANQVIKAAADDQFTGLTKNVVVAGVCDNLVITDGAPLGIAEGFEATSVTYTRTMGNAWGTIILPFALTSDENVQFYSLKESDEEYMTFKEESFVEANTPVAFKKLTDEGSITISGGNVDVVATNSDQNDITTATNWSAEGSYTAQSFEEYNGIYYIASNKFWAANGTMTVNPFRAIFRYSGGGAVKSFAIHVADADAITDIVDGESANGQWYDLSGRQINTPQQRGIYIRNGKKTIIK